MRLIDKLPLLKPPEEKYNLIDTSKITTLIGRRNKVAFTFVIDNMFYRSLTFDSKYRKVLPNFEKSYPEETPFEEVLNDFTKELNEIKQKYNVDFKKFKVGTYVPTRYGLLKIYNFPKTLKKVELLRSIELYIQQDIAENFPEKEVVYSYDILPTERDEPYRVLITIVEKELVDKLYEWSINNGIDLDIISFEPVTLINLGLYKNLPEPFSILYTDINKILVLSYQKDRILYEEFSFIFSPDSIAEDVANLIIWDIRNYIVLNDLGNIYLAGIVTEYEHLMQYFLEKLPIFGIVTIDKFPERYSLLYILGERLLHGKTL
jgi:type IV pilus assembly protein PilM